MQSRLALAVLAACGCGRIDFAPHDAPAGGSDASDASDDALVPQVGCADGEREGFVDLIAFPRIAGCGATWAETPSLRASSLLAGPCGDDLGPCNVPAAACAPGWHLCGTSGDPADLTSRITAAQCLDAGGVPGTAFIAALDHCTSCDGGCTDISLCHYAATYECSQAMFCAEAVCCGTMCGGGNQCQDGIFASPDTHTNLSPCGASLATDQTGVLCCAD